MADFEGENRGEIFVCRDLNVATLEIYAVVVDIFYSNHKKRRRTVPLQMHNYSTVPFCRSHLNDTLLGVVENT